MPKLHVIYDPHDRVEVPDPEVLKSLKLRIAVLSLSDDQDPNHIATRALEVAHILLKELRDERALPHSPQSPG